MLFILFLPMFLLSHATEIFWQIQEYFRKMNKSNELQNVLVYENINVLFSFFWIRKSHRSVRLRKWFSHWQENRCRWLKIWNLLAFYFPYIKKINLTTAKFLQNKKPSMAMRRQAKKRRLMIQLPAAPKMSEHLKTTMIYYAHSWGSERVQRYYLQHVSLTG